MSTQLFGPPASGGSFTDNVNRARNFLQQSRTRGAEEIVESTQAHGLAAEAPAAPIDVAAPAPAAAAPTAYVDAPVTAAVSGHDPDALAAAARSAAEQAVTDPAVQQQVEVIVQPRIMTQAQPGPVYVPVDIAIPATHTNVTIQPATTVVLDQAGQPVSSAASIAGEAPAARGFRNWGAGDLGALLNGRRAAADAAAPAPIANVASEAGPSLLDRIRANTGGIGTRLNTSATETAQVVDAGVSGVRAGLLDQLRDAAQLATKVNPRG